MWYVISYEKRPKGRRKRELLNSMKQIKAQEEVRAQR